MLSIGMWMIWLGCTQNLEDTKTTTNPPVEIFPATSQTRAKARHLLIGYEGAWRSSSRRSKEDALRQIQLYQVQITSGMDFASIAQQHSEDPQKKDGGGLGVVERGQMLPEFETALFNLQCNEISEVVETGFGYHLIQRLPLEERQLIHISVDSEEKRNIVAGELLNNSDPRMLAKSYSISPHGTRGGELGWFERTDLDAIFVKPVFDLQLGECTEGIKRENQWHFFCRQG